MEEKKEEEGRELKSGEVVGVASEVLIDAFRNLNVRRSEAWLELQRIDGESRKLWAQLESDLELSDKYVYTISPVSGKVQMVRRHSQSEAEFQREMRLEALKEAEGEE
ncbi:MAG: hypothetical protein H8D26_04655 [Methanomicrobia archaeon]|nr:hypothetical protein [Methanomicrobia archaeon]